MKITVNPTLDPQGVSRGTTFQFDYEDVKDGATILLRNLIVPVTGSSVAAELRKLGGVLMALQPEDIDLV
jgi:hypothetical protein